MAWYVYLIECRDGSIYTGIAVDVAARYAAHAGGKGARYTRSHPPQRLLAAFECADRSEASRAEYRIKRLAPGAKRSLALSQGAIGKGASRVDALLRINSRVAIPLEEIGIRAVRAQGAGGQNVNKVSSAIHLRFDIAASTLPQDCKERLRKLGDQRISKDGIVVIKAQRFRSQDKNREDALARLQDLVRGIAAAPKQRRPTRPPRSAGEKRIESKVRHGRIKALRARVTE